MKASCIFKVVGFVTIFITVACAPTDTEEAPPEPAAPRLKALPNIVDERLGRWRCSTEGSLAYGRGSSVKLANWPGEPGTFTIEVVPCREGFVFPNIAAYCANKNYDLLLRQEGVPGLYPHLVGRSARPTPEGEYDMWNEGGPFSTIPGCPGCIPEQFALVEKGGGISLRAGADFELYQHDLGQDGGGEMVLITRYLAGDCSFVR